MNHGFFAFIAIVFSLFPAMAIASESKHVQHQEHYTFDKVHTQILFFVDHAGFSTSEGEFQDFDGEIIFDRTHPEHSSVSVTIKTDSIDMDDEKWNTHMKSKDFFNTDVFPNMTFESTAIKKIGEKRANIEGNLTILGVTQPVILKTKYNKSDENPFNGTFVSGFSATAQIKRSDFGMTYGLPAVGDDVEIRIEVEAVRTKRVPKDIEPVAN